MFVVPQYRPMMQMPQVQQRQQTNQLQTGTNAVTQTPQQSNPMGAVGGVMSASSAGKGAANLANDVGTLYSRWTMPSGVNPASVLYDPSAEAANTSGLLNGGTQSANMLAGQSTFPLATNSFAPSSASPMLDSAIASNPMMAAGTDAAASSGTAMMGDASGMAANTATDALANAAMSGGVESLGAGAAADAGSAAAGEAATELGLSSLGPIGLLAGGLYGIGNLFDWW